MNFPVEQIARSSPNGSHTDIVVPGAVSKHIAIHSIKGRLFWITDHSVDGSLLNGEEHCIYWGSPFFSVRQGSSFSSFILQRK